MENICIGITDSRKFEDYSKWILSENPYIHIIRLSYQLNNISQVADCHGIILTGGEDVHPKFYNKLDYLPILNPNQIDENRDLFELKIIESVFQFKKPLLGICRGLQITNVALGGSLIPDIPTVFGNLQHGKIEGKDQLHEVNIIQGTSIQNITTQTTGIVNSAHHQSADEIGVGLIATAYSSTNTNKKIIEALEWEQPENNSWLLLVQWHPERIAENEFFSKSIRSAFLHEVSKK